MDTGHRLDRGNGRRRHHCSFAVGGGRLRVKKIEPLFAIEPTPDLSKTISRLSLLTALVASQIYLIHAAFFAHALTPISVYVIDPKTQLHLMSGQVGNIEEVFHLDGLIPTILVSVLVFVLGWMVARATARLYGRSRTRVLLGDSPIDTNSFKATAPSDVASVSTRVVA